MATINPFSRPEFSEEWRNAGWTVVPVSSEWIPVPGLRFKGVDAETLWNAKEWVGASHFAVRLEPGHLLLDVDRKDGKDGFARLEELGHRLPDGPFGVSRSGAGKHFYLTVPPGVPCYGSASGAVARGVDLKGEGSLVYPRYSPVPFAPAPAWLVDWLVDRGPKREGTGSAAVLPDGPMCREVSAIRVPDPATRDAVMPLVFRLVQLGHEGHSGVPQALGVLRDRYVTAPSSRSEVDLERDFDRLVQGVPTSGPAAPRCFCTVSLGASTLSEALEGPSEALEPQGGTPELPDSFWALSEALGRVRQMARANMASPDTALLGVLVQLAGHLPPGFGVQGLPGAPVCMNFLASAVGPSGSGKSLALRCGRTLLGVEGRSGDVFFADGVGTGEGMIDAFFDDRQVGTTASGSPRTGLVQAYDGVVLWTPEGEGLSSQLNTPNTSAASVLRKLWDGESIATVASKRGTPGQGRSRALAAPYSFGLCVGYQDRTLAGLMEGEAGGTPQRFVYLGVTDSSAPPEPPPPPGPVRVRLPMPGETWRLPGAALSQLTERRRVQLRGGSTGESPLDQHWPLLAIKLAGLLAVLDNAGEVRPEHWEGALTVWGTSCAVRSRALSTARRAAYRAKDVEAVVAARAQEAADEDMRARAERRVRELASQGLRRADVRRALSAGQRRFLADIWPSGDAEFTDRDETPISDTKSAQG